IGGLKMKNKILFIGTVRMWGINLHEIESLNKGKNPDYFKNISLSKRIFATEHLNKVIKDNDYIFLAVPSKALKEATQKIVSQINNSPIFINLAKDLTIATKVSNLFLNSLYFKAIPLNDEIGVEICGALKNLLAIGTGIAQENHSSINTISAILTQGIKEIKEIILLKGGQELTILNLSGIGDMFLTCTSKQSRNFSFGKNLYREKMTSLNLTPKYILGKNSIEHLTFFLKEKKAQKISLIYGGGSIKNNGLYNKIIEICKLLKLEIQEIGGIQPNPLDTSI
uniref:Glycerol-3-phosphate dehydrogenase (NAD(+)) n=1 Tax=Gouania willdenowi TaxID=441366 RepID=A0A8C5GQW8_GOUWI